MNLKEAFIICLSGKQKFAECRYIIDYAHTIALAYLRMKISSGHLYTHSGEPLEDLAWDFIAELFERDDNHSFVVLNEIFSAQDLKVAHVEEVEHQFRRVIITKVDDNIFRSNGEKDLSLKKIIRNLKNAVNNTGATRQIEVHHGYLLINNCLNGNSQPLLSPTDILEIELCHRLRDTMQMPEVLAEVVDILETFRLHQNKISLVAVAICIRKAFVHVNDEVKKTHVGKDSEEALHQKSLLKRIEKSADQVKKTVGRKYVKKGVLNAEELHHFMLAVKQILKLEFVEKHDEANHFDCLASIIPSLDYEEYRKNSRQVLEYLVKKTRSEILRFYEKEWS
jgi:hypothetical protein